jgi:hypothetical protein
MIPVKDLQEKMRRVVDAIRQVDDPNIYAQMVDLERDILDLIREQTHLKTDLENVRNEMNTEKTLVRNGDLYYLPGAAQGRQGPYCMKCWDDEKKLMTMMRCDEYAVQRRKCQSVVDVNRRPEIPDVVQDWNP